jgi:hypothetical protein
MFPAYTDQDIVSELPDIGELPLDAEVYVDEAEYARIMRRLITLDGEPLPSVSAFNSSI